MNHWDLKPLQAHYIGFTIGAGLHFSTPVVQKTYCDPTQWRCVQALVSFMGFMVIFTWPLFPEDQ